MKQVVYYEMIKQQSDNAAWGFQNPDATPYSIRMNEAMH